MSIANKQTGSTSRAKDETFEETTHLRVTIARFAPFLTALVALRPLLRGIGLHSQVSSDKEHL